MYIFFFYSVVSSCSPFLCGFSQLDGVCFLVFVLVSTLNFERAGENGRTIYIYIYDYTRSLLMPVFLFCCSFLPIFMVDSKCHLLSWMKQNTTLWPTFTQSQRNPAQIKITCDTFYFVITTVRLRAHMPRAFRLNCLYSPIYILKRLLSKYWLKLEHSHYSY